ncbi:hypothetical protein AM493_13880 [Flavobacterium akiainvivens]|uniref:Uncharacterized protein n=1 Tax=Flavobacterium akiainvivens TaxID=1202724 RepID=A0A0N0RQV6_9FLAO|nr:hypothetical protein [Flavobacterium akiainvivens]KOS06999.1 hypothetical protein AM493_13880 [Flavobacterium akiainvivens]SFQ59351.1 hypothetical protein SAMN05444144_109100 [Flavobacterium akiainvivens]
MFKWLFGKKIAKPVPRFDFANMPALNEWGVFYQGGGLSLYSRFAGQLPGGTQYIYLKSFPEALPLERNIFGDWLCPVSTGVYLQQWADTTGTKAALVFVSNEGEARIVKEDIEGTDWQSGYEGGKPVIDFGGAIEKFKIE